MSDSDTLVALVPPDGPNAPVWRSRTWLDGAPAPGRKSYR